MATFKERFPPKADLFAAFAFCLIVVQVWVTINIFKVVPSWMLRLNLWDLIGAIAYTQVFTLLESFLVFALITLAALLLPAFLFRSRYLALTAALVLLLAAWVILFHYFENVILAWGLVRLLPLLLAFIASIVLVYVLVLRSTQLDAAIRWTVDHLVVLGIVYLMIDLVSLLIVFARNLG